jgi:hypothetical protein
LETTLEIMYSYRRTWRPLQFRIIFNTKRTLCTVSLHNFHASYVPPTSKFHRVHLLVLWLSQQTPIIALYSVTRCTFSMELRCSLWVRNWMTFNSVTNILLYVTFNSDYQ